MFVIIGPVAGWLARGIMRHHGFGVVGSLALGVPGVLLGGLPSGALGLPPAANPFGRLVSATIGAVPLLSVADRVRRRA